MQRGLLPRQHLLKRQLRLQVVIQHIGRADQPVGFQPEPEEAQGFFLLPPGFVATGICKGSRKFAGTGDDELGLAAALYRIDPLQIVVVALEENIDTLGTKGRVQKILQGLPLAVMGRASGIWS